MVLPIGLRQRAMQGLNRPSALDFIGRPETDAPAGQMVSPNLMPLRQKVLQQQMRPLLTPAQQFRQLSGMPAAERMPKPQKPKGLLGMLPEAGTPEMAGIGAAGQKLLELSGYREVPITTAEALGQAAGAFREARGAATQAQREEAQLKAQAERQARLDKMAADKQAAELANIRSQISEREKPVEPKYGTTKFGNKLFQTVDGKIVGDAIMTKPDEAPVSGLPNIGDTREIHIGGGLFQTQEWMGQSYADVGRPILKDESEAKPLSNVGKIAADLGYDYGTEGHRQTTLRLLAEQRGGQSKTALQKEAADIFLDSEAPVGSPQYEQEMKEIRKKRADWVNQIRTSPRGLTQRAGVVLDANGRRVGRAIFNPRPAEGESPVMVEEGGKLRALREGERSVEKDMMSKMLLPQTQYNKLENELLSQKQSMRKLNEYSENIANSPVGGARLVSEFSTFAKTFFNEVLPEDLRGLTFSELSLQLAKGQLQGLIGASRLEVVGGGVMTEQDAIRILQYLGGDVSVLQNPERVANAIQKVLREKAESYNVMARQFNEQSAYRGLRKDFVEPVEINMDLIQSITPADIDLSVAPKGFDPNDWSVLSERDRLEYLEAVDG